MMRNTEFDALMETLTEHFAVIRGVLCGMDCELCASLVEIVREDDGLSNPADIIPLDEDEDEEIYEQ